MTAAEDSHKLQVCPPCMCHHRPLELWRKATKHTRVPAKEKEGQCAADSRDPYLFLSWCVSGVTILSVLCEVHHTMSRSTFVLTGPGHMSSDAIGKDKHRRRRE